MQKEPGQYEVPAERLVHTYDGGRLGEGSDLGQAVIVSTLFGNPRVRIVREGDQPRWLWPVFAVLVAAGIGAAVWFWMGAPRQEPVRNDVPELVPAPPAPPVVEIPATAPQPTPVPVQSAIEARPAPGAPRAPGAAQTRTAPERAATYDAETQPEIGGSTKSAPPKKQPVDRAPSEATHEPAHLETGRSAKAASTLGDAKPAKRSVTREIPAAAGDRGAVSALPTLSSASKPVESESKKDSAVIPSPVKPARESSEAAMPAMSSQPATAAEPQP